ncbi:hypothetical protein F4859DRAFT_473994 [Xylaria cf. heliscus]|nr:hypothetical protein F4859DRAFT_473994 [Xylaria cf. heliscus]
MASDRENTKLIPATISVSIAGVPNTTTMALPRVKCNSIMSMEMDVEAYAGEQIPHSLDTMQSRSCLKMEKLDCSPWQELSAKIDTLSTDMSEIKLSLKELHQGKSDNLSLEEDLKQAQDDLQLARENYGEIHKRWKRAVSQLDQLQYKGTEMSQLTDGDLIRQVRELRYKIKNFSSQYFQCKVSQQHRDTSRNNFWKYMTAVTFTGSHDHYHDLMSETRRSILIQAFLWRLLVGEVFGKFCWVPSLREPVTKVYEALRPAYVEKSNQEVPIASRSDEKFQAWSATTSALILELTQNNSFKEGNNSETNLLVHDFSVQIIDVIGPFAIGSPSMISSDLHSIIEAAIDLDRNIFTKAASVHWIFTSSGCQVQLDSDLMDLQEKEVASRSEECVDVVTAPALVKRSKCIGTKSGLEEMVLVKMAVTRMALSGGYDPRGSSSRPGIRGRNTNFLRGVHY